MHEDNADDASSSCAAVYAGKRGWGGLLVNLSSAPAGKVPTAAEHHLLRGVRLLARDKGAAFPRRSGAAFLFDPCPLAKGRVNV